MYVCMYVCMYMYMYIYEIASLAHVASLHPSRSRSRSRSRSPRSLFLFSLSLSFFLSLSLSLCSCCAKGCVKRPVFLISPPQELSLKAARRVLLDAFLKASKAAACRLSFLKQVKQQLAGYQARSILDASALTACARICP